jgi:hypothetical protein
VLRTIIHQELAAVIGTGLADVIGTGFIRVHLRLINRP